MLLLDMGFWEFVLEGLKGLLFTAYFVAVISLFWVFTVYLFKEIKHSKGFEAGVLTIIFVCLVTMVTYLSLLLGAYII